MTDTQELKCEMVRHNDNGGMLAAALGITHPTLSNKINNKNGSEFTQNEICIIKERYDLSNERLGIIFFTK